PNSADVLVGELPAGVHDFVLYDGMQEVARLPQAVTIEASPATRVAAAGILIHLDRTVATQLSVSPSPSSPNAIVKLGDARQESTGGWQRRAEIVLQCDPDPSREGCAVG